MKAKTELILWLGLSFVWKFQLLPVSGDRDFLSEQLKEYENKKRPPATNRWSSCCRRWLETNSRTCRFGDAGDEHGAQSPVEIPKRSDGFDERIARDIEIPAHVVVTEHPERGSGLRLLFDAAALLTTDLDTIETAFFGRLMSLPPEGTLEGGHENLSAVEALDVISGLVIHEGLNLVEIGENSLTSSQIQIQSKINSYTEIIHLIYRNVK